jgi:hypothetical protein
VSLVKYELGFHIPEVDILHSDRRGRLKPYVTIVNEPMLCENTESREGALSVARHDRLLPSEQTVQRIWPCAPRYILQEMDGLFNRPGKLLVVLASPSKILSSEHRGFHVRVKPAGSRS